MAVVTPLVVLTGLVPSVAEPSMNVTVPVADEGLTVAVNVTGWPYTEGFAEDETVATVAGSVFVNEKFTDDDSGIEALTRYGPPMTLLAVA